MGDDMGCGIAKTLLKAFLIGAIIFYAVGFAIYFIIKHYTSWLS